MLVGNARIGCQFSVVVTCWTSSFIFVVTQRQARLVPERVTVFGRVNHLGAETRHPGLFSLSPPSVADCSKYLAKAGAVNRHIAWYNSPYPWSRSVVLVPGWTDWLAETSADLREAIAHLRRVRDYALYKSTVYFTLLYIVNRISSHLSCLSRLAGGL